MNWLMLVGSVIAFGYAFYLLFARDKVWEQHLKSQRSKGIKAEMLERTDEWENRMIQSGVMMLIFGFLLLATFFCSPRP